MMWEDCDHLPSRRFLHPLARHTKEDRMTTQTDKATEMIETGKAALVSSPSLDELSLLREHLTISDTTVFAWDVAEDHFIWAGNAPVVLPEFKKLPASMKEFAELVADEDKNRFKALQHSIYRHTRDIDMEYSLQLEDGQKLRIRHIGRIIRKEHDKPATLINTLMVLTHGASADNPLEFLSGDFSDRRVNDRRGYHYPPAFMKHLHDAIQHSIRHHEEGSFLLLAVNNLAMIIHGYGFESSEKVLTDIKQAIGAILGPHDYVERIHRDQFGIVLADCARADSEERANIIKDTIQKLTLHHAVGPLHITCSIGSVGFPLPATSVADCLDKAYIALNNHNNLVFSAFDETDYDSEKSRQQMALANYLHDAIEENRLRLAFQPIIHSKTGKVGHYECLLRIIDKEGKITSAGPLIPVAERMGLIEVIDKLVVERVVNELRQHPTVELAFNISSVTTGNPEWLRFLASLLNDDLSIASRMIVEITETAAQRDLRETAYFVASVQALGCQVSLDDFGSGYTSFRQLKALSVDMLKIDGAFIRDLVDNADNRFFVKTLLDFTAGYGLHTVAEFVESGEIAKMLMELGVDYMQGYYFSQPLNYRPWMNEGENKQ